MPKEGRIISEFPVTSLTNLSYIKIGEVLWIINAGDAPVFSHTANCLPDEAC